MKMGLLRFYLYCVLKCLRLFIDYSTEVVCGLLYRKSKPLPPITNPLLLEPATKLAAKIRRKEVKSVDIVKAFIARIREVQPVINAVVDERFQAAILEAEAYDTAIESDMKPEAEIERDTPLLGVPFSSKEPIAVKGMSLAAGLYSRKSVKAEDDSDVVKRLKEAGGIPIVVTNVPVLCMAWETGNYVFGTTCNPYDTRRICGGSSGGEGSLIAAAGSVIGTGSDLGGSIRIPAFMNGIFGHKPSTGVVSNVGHFPPCEESINQYVCCGPMCRYASDLLPMLKILSSNNPKLQLGKPVNLRQLKIYYMEDDGGNPFVTPVVPAVKKALRKVVKHFEDNYNVKAEKIKLDELKESYFIWCYHFTAVAVVSIRELFTGKKGNLYSFLYCFYDFLKWCFHCSKHTLPAHFACLTLFKTPGFMCSKTKQSAVENLQKLQKQFENLLDENSVFLYPTQPEPAPYHHLTVPKSYTCGYTGIFNILRLPATHCPVDLYKGLPVGIQVVTRKYNDRLSFAVAVEIEKAFGGWVPPCPVL